MPKPKKQRGEQPAPIRLKVLEKIINKPDGMQDVTLAVVDAATGAPVMGLVGVSTQFNQGGRIVTVQLSGVLHEIENR